jgi:putative transposase
LLPEVRKQYWGQRFWWRWYLAVSSWSITDEMIQSYIDNQDGTEIDENFTVEH